MRMTYQGMGEAAGIKEKSDDMGEKRKDVCGSEFFERVFLIPDLTRVVDGC
jgi:hypothetical protein